MTAWTMERATHFGAVLQEVRAEAGLTARTLARRSDVSHSTIYRLEAAGVGSNGRLIQPLPDTLRKLSAGLAASTHAADAEMIWKRLMAACGYGGEALVQWRPAMQVNVRISRQLGAAHLVEVEMTGDDPVEVLRRARDAAAELEGWHAGFE